MSKAGRFGRGQPDTVPNMTMHAGEEPSILLPEFDIQVVKDTICALESVTLRIWPKSLPDADLVLP